MKVSWEYFDWLVEQIADQYYGKNITRVVGITRGGLCAAVKLSHLLDCDMDTIKFQTRDSKCDGALYILNDDLDRLGDISNTLFVDDICDSGKTIKAIKKFRREARFTTLINKQRGLVEYSPITTEDDSWIDFPWEAHNSNR